MSKDKCDNWLLGNVLNHATPVALWLEHNLALKDMHISLQLIQQQFDDFDVTPDKTQLLLDDIFSPCNF